MKTNNRELSWLAFNRRVLQEAQDPTVPLMQRLRFLGIFSNNEDEFIKVRVANTIRETNLTNRYPRKKAGIEKGLLQRINDSMQEARDRFEQTYLDILSQMEEHGIRIIHENELSERQKEFCRHYYASVISVRLVPLMLRKTVTLPFLSDQHAYLAVKMSNRTNQSKRYALIQLYVSKLCPRFVELPSEKAAKEIIFMEDIIRLCLDDIFFMFNFDDIQAYTFKFLRDALMSFDDDISKSVVEKLEDSLEERQHGQPIRLVYDKEMPEDLLSLIASKLKIKPDQVLPGGRYHMLRDLMKFPKVAPELELKRPDPLTHPDIRPFSSVLDVIREKDIFLNYPYHTFNHLIDFLREAAIDPKVKSINITLYRTAENSKVINALINAVKNGKQVTVLEELMARFDEEQNVEDSDKMQKAGIRVIHGLPGIKVHSKLILIERKEKNATRGYVYVGTGNFNEVTAGLYGDFGILTTHPEIAADARRIFDFLLRPHQHFRCKHLLVAPYYMRDSLEARIGNEIRNARKGKKAFIHAKMNSLTDPGIVRLLYKASQHGVKIRLIVRGACCLQPQVKGQSDTIEVISIVDSYLEHARMLIFCNNGDEKIYILSADWMTRNLDRRIEVAIPVYDKKIRQTLKDVFHIQWADNVKARELTDPDSNPYRKRETDTLCRSQMELFTYYKNK